MKLSLGSEFIGKNKVNLLFFLVAVYLLSAHKASSEEAFKRGVVISQNKIASAAGAKILSVGGNAVDAAITTAYALGVVEPNGSGIGGGGFALVYLSKDKSLVAVDFRERAPARINQEKYQFVQGPKAGGIPGTVKGMEFLRSHYGTLDRKTLLEEPYELALKGFPINITLKNAIERQQKTLAEFNDSKKIFLLDGKAPDLGYKLEQKDLAKTIKEIQIHGSKGFYEGFLASKIAASIQSSGGLIDKEDLENYEVRLYEPLCGNYREKYKVCSFPLPSSGGVCVLESLNILENFDLPKYDYKSPERIHFLIEALKFSFSDRASRLGDPKFNNIDIQPLLSKKRAFSIAKIITDTSKSSPGNLPSEQIPTLNLQPYSETNSEKPETTHFTVVDKEGNIVVITTSLNGALGSGFVIPGTGILLNNTLDDFALPSQSNQYGLVGNNLNSPAPYKTPLSSMTPTIVFDEVNKPLLALGSPGGPTIISAVLNTLLAFMDHKMSIKEAVSAGRVHHQWMPDLVFAERELIDTKLQRILKEKYGYNYPTKETNVWKRFYWSVQAAELNWENGTIEGASDPRTEQGLVYEVVD